jgi:putative membrane protein insertion efficiency factor
VLKGLSLLLLAPIRLYKLTLSRLLPPACRFHPSCSVYAMGAIAVHGPFRGTALALRRISRCHPFHPGGLDPVPPRDGQSAEQLLATEAPDIARRLLEAPPPHLAAVISSPPRS